MDHTGTDPDLANKRAALAGQWQTPPMQMYPSGYAQAPSNHAQQHQPVPIQAAPGAPPPQGQRRVIEISAPAPIPNNSEDYAKALQEAYRKGAEAAARMAQQQITTTASCPNFSTGQQAGLPPPPPSPAGVAAEEAAYASQVHTTLNPLPSIPDPLANSSMPPPPPQHNHSTPPPPIKQPAPLQPPQGMHHASSAPGTMQHHHLQHHQHHHHHPPVGQPPRPLEYSSSVQPPQQQQQQQQQQGGTKPNQARSISMPDMSAYSAQAEEEKRQKRLARNRASARLRRLRKKNLVDAYETEVGILEKTLKQLQAHEWGKADDHTALLEALGMERGQQAIQPEQRTSIIKDILNQQMQHVELLRQAQMEQECLAMLASGTAADDELARELQDVLQLTDEQNRELQVSSQGLEGEIEALETVAASLKAMQENDWLVNEGVQSITDQFTTILHKNQLSKFLLWTDANQEAIDQLDHVQVQPLQAAPVFTFGVETTPGEEDEGKL